jgi:hypothetical protein
MSVVDSDDLTARRELMQTLRVVLLKSDNRWMRQMPVRLGPLGYSSAARLLVGKFRLLEESDDRKIQHPKQQTLGSK